jgi:hypothetical protein
LPTIRNHLPVVRLQEEESDFEAGHHAGFGAVGFDAFQIKIKKRLNLLAALCWDQIELET